MSWLWYTFFGGGAAVIAHSLLNPKKVPTKLTLSRRDLEEFSKLEADLGPFVYTEEGFILKSRHIQTKWSDIDTIFGFKLDLLVVDEICMDIFANNWKLRLSEGMAGWCQFNNRLAESLPGIQKNWDIEISSPAFKTNMTLLYDKWHRCLAEAEAACYNE